MLQTQLNSAEPKPTPVRSETVRSQIVSVDGKTVPDAYLRRIELGRHTRALLVKKNGEYVPIPWSTYHSKILSLFRSLREHGIQRGDRVGIMSSTRPEWAWSDVAILCSGAVTVPIYASNSEEDIRFIIQDSAMKLLFVEEASMVAKVAAALKALEKDLTIVTLCDLPLEYEAASGRKWTLTFAEFSKELANEAEVEKEMVSTISFISPDQIATIVYTSGTTGQPKGAVLTQANLAGEMRGIINQIDIYGTDVSLCFLPFAHVLGRLEVLAPIFVGITVAFAENISTVAQNISEAKPTFLISVPRIYEKIYAKILSEVESQGELKKKVFQWAVSVGRQVARFRAEKKSIPLPLLLKFTIADQLVLSKIREKMGGNIRFTVSGGAPLSRELCEFFHACGVKILEGYGLTETIAAISVNLPDDYCFGTVGKLLPGMEVKIADDGEILVRGPMVFKEYYNNPEATKACFQNGWFATGDIGEINDRGFLKITDRKKEIIVTSGGKKIAPQKLENLLKASRFVSNILILGDKEKYISALITLNEPEIALWAKQKGIGFTCPEDLSKNEEVAALIQTEVENANKSLAGFESIKKFRILPRDFTVESGELTPSLKVKRRVVVEKYKNFARELYA